MDLLKLVPLSVDLERFYCILNIQIYMQLSTECCVAAPAGGQGEEHALQTESPEAFIYFLANMFRQSYASFGKHFNNTPLVLSITKRCTLSLHTTQERCFPSPTLPTPDFRSVFCSGWTVHPGAIRDLPVYIDSSNQPSPRYQPGGQRIPSILLGVIRGDRGGIGIGNAESCLYRTRAAQCRLIVADVDSRDHRDATK